MAQLDDIVGAVMKKLKDMGVDDNTIVVFTTDNGTENFTWPDGGQTPFAQSKGTVMEGGFRVPGMIRWPGKVPAGKVENGIISGLDWFPTFVAAAGNPNIADELKQGKQLGDTTYKVHLDGYDQTDMITGKGPSNRHEIFYFGESTLGAVRIDDFKYRFIDQPGGWLGDKTKPDVPYLTNLRLDPFERTGWPDSGTKIGRAAILRLVQVRVLALRVRPAGSGEARHDRDRVPADAEGRELQPRCREGEDRSGPGGDGQVANEDRGAAVPSLLSKGRRKPMRWMRSALAFIVVCVAVSACANQVQNKEDMLAASGFTVVPANTPQRQTSLTTLPPHKFVQQVRKNAVIYVYADPTICQCLYVGNQAAYDRYRANVFQKKLADEQAFTAQVNEMNWEGWGPGWYHALTHVRGRAEHRLSPRLSADAGARLVQHRHVKGRGDDRGTQAAAACWQRSVSAVCSRPAPKSGGIMKRRFWTLACVGVAQAGSVNAMDSCVGHYSAALLSALPVPTVVAVDVPDSTPTNPNLVQAFTRGMTEAGQNTSSPPTAKLALTYQVTGQGGGGGNDGSDQPGGTAGGWSQQLAGAARWRDRRAARHPVVRHVRAEAGRAVRAAVHAGAVAAGRFQRAGLDRHSAMHLAARRQPTARVSARLPDRRSDRKAD